MTGGNLGGWLNSRDGRWLRIAVLPWAMCLALFFSYSHASEPPGSPPSVGFARHAIATPHPLASEAGLRMLRAGGSAIDAAIAAQMVLTLVEPQSSGIGGGGFLMHFDGKQVDAWDGREVAPAAADESLFLDAQGKPLGFYAGVVGGRSVGVPGLLAMLEEAHRAHGKLPWSHLFAPAIELAEEGFAVSPRLAKALAVDRHLKTDADAAAYFLGPSGFPRPIGHRLKNVELAQVLREIAVGGSDAFYLGKTAEAMVNKVRQSANAGRLATGDLAAYRPIRREPVCSDWRAYRICGFPPPSSGAIAVGQILGLLERRPVRPSAASLLGGVPSAEFLHDYTEAARLAFADRARYLGDPDFAKPPGGHWATLLASDYLDRRARQIGDRSMGRAPWGDPTAKDATVPTDVPEEAVELPSTSHLSVVDASGNAVALTSSIEDAFGSRIMVRGFMLNNQLTDFSFDPGSGVSRRANRVEAGKRPRSSMSPTLVFEKDSGRLVMSAGSPGGAQIIHYTAKVLLGVLAMGLDVQAAIDLPNFGSSNGPTELELASFPVQTAEALRARGHEVRERNMVSGIQALVRTARGWQGGADRRREGTVRGE